MYGGEVNTGFWWGNLRERDLSDDPGIDGRMILKWDHQEEGCGGSIRLRIGTGGGLL
jgi:hypothetical protein